MHDHSVGDRLETALRGRRVPEVPPWSVTEGFSLLLMFLVIHLFLVQLMVVFSARESGPALQIATSNAAVLTVIYVFLTRRTGDGARAASAVWLPVRRPLQALVRAAGLLALGVVALGAWAALQAYVMQRCGWRWREQDAVRLIRTLSRAGERFETGVLVFLAVVIVPPVEELMFRGMLYLPLRHRWSVVPAALVVSAIFAGVHGYPLGFGHLFILAMLFCWLMEVTGTILAPILAHAAHNAVMIALLFAGSGLENGGTIP